jgi:hypothetical protein
MYFTYWINIQVEKSQTLDIPDSYARWIFALLSRVDDFVSADDMSLLRNVARACISVLKESVRTRIKARGVGELRMLNVDNGEAHSMGERSCWIVVCVIIGVWAQRDLWIDVEASLRELTTET